MYHLVYNLRSKVSGKLLQNRYGLVCVWSREDAAIYMRQWFCTGQYDAVPSPAVSEFVYV